MLMLTVRKMLTARLTWQTHSAMGKMRLKTWSVLPMAMGATKRLLRRKMRSAMQRHTRRWLKMLLISFLVRTARLIILPAEPAVPVMIVATPPTQYLLS